MNKSQRKQASALADEITSLLERVEQLRDEAQEKFDNMPESLQNSDNGQKAEEHLSSIDTACELLESARDALQEIEG